MLNPTLKQLHPLGQTSALVRVSKQLNKNNLILSTLNLFYRLVSLENSIVRKKRRWNCTKGVNWGGLLQNNSVCAGPGGKFQFFKFQKKNANGRSASRSQKKTEKDSFSKIINALINKSALIYTQYSCSLFYNLFLYPFGFVQF